MPEFDFIQWIKEQNNFDNSILLGIGDDAALVDCKNLNALAISTDTIMQNVDFILDPNTLYGIGWKALCVSLSDIAAMGLLPYAATCAMAIPPGVSRKNLQEIYRGLKAASDQFNCPVIGGDISTAPADALSLTSTVLGKTPDPNSGAITRDDALVGDIIAVTGTLGGSILGKHLNFTPRCQEAAYLNTNYTLHAMIDISDGLSGDLQHICNASGVGALLDADKIPIDNAAIQCAKTSSRTPLQHALHDGEDFELLFTLDKHAWQILEQDNTIQTTAIGTITETDLLIAINGNYEILHPQSHVHDI